MICCLSEETSPESGKKNQKASNEDTDTECRTRCGNTDLLKRTNLNYTSG